jgi:monoterpene epsilon-lactone hydrolase
MGRRSRPARRLRGNVNDVGDAADFGPWRVPRPRESSIATPPELRDLRASILQPVPTSTATVHVSAETLHGVPCVVCEPDGPVASLVYLHGGGFRLGSAAGSAAFGIRMADAARARVVVVDYGLAPEHPFPAGLRDAIAVYDATRSRWAQPVLVGGDSAGGGLATSLVAAALAAGLPLPGGAALFSPWVDLTVTAATYESRADSDLLFSTVRAREAAQLYLQGWDPRDPLASPLFAELKGFPPTLVFVGSEEVLLDDSLALGRALTGAGGTVNVRVVDGMQHVWPAIFPDLPESDAALRQLGDFVTRLVSSD